MRYEQLSIGEILGSAGIITDFGTTVPVDGSSGYSPGCAFGKNNAGQDGNPVYFTNVGTASSCKFRVAGVVSGWSIGYGAVDIPCTSTSLILPAPSDLYGKMVTDPVFGGFSTTNDADTVVELTGNATNNVATFMLSADPSTVHKVSLGVAQQGIMPRYVCTFAGTQVTIANLATTPVINTKTLTGANVGDLAFATYNTTDDTDQVTGAYISAADTLTVNLTANPVVAHNFNYAVFAPIGSAIPAYYIAYAGVVTSGSGDDGGATEVFTVSGALTTDVVILRINDKGGTPVTLKSATISAADSLTVVMSGDPAADHDYSYMILRAV